MKAAVVKRLAEERTLVELQRGAEAIAEREIDELGVDGDDLGEKLTHLMLAIRVRERVEAGEDPKAAFRSEMSAVREVLANE